MSNSVYTPTPQGHTIRKRLSRRELVYHDESPYLPPPVPLLPSIYRNETSRLVSTPIDDQPARTESLRPQPSTRDLQPNASYKSLRSPAYSQDFSSHSSSRDYSTHSSSMIRSQASSRDLRSQASSRDSRSQASSRDLRSQASSRDLRSQASSRDLRSQASSRDLRSEGDPHLRHKRRVSFIPLPLPLQPSPQVEKLSKACISRIKSEYTKISPPHSDNLRESQIVPEIFLPTSAISRSLEIGHEEQNQTRPDLFVAPSKLLLGRRVDKYVGWMRDALLYGSGEERGLAGPEHKYMPDIFSRCHDMSAQSNGTLFIVTLYAEDISLPRSALLSSTFGPSTLHIYASPGSAVDMIKLDAVGKRFQKQTEYLFGPSKLLRMGGCEKTDTYQPSTAKNDKVDDETGTPIAFEITNKERDVRWDGPNMRDETITERDLDYLLGQVSRSAMPSEIIPLDPQYKERFQCSGNLHTYERGSPKLYSREGIEDVRVGKPANACDPGHDMRIVCSLTGGLGCTFAYLLDDTGLSPKISAKAYASWQFWDIHRPLIATWSDQIFEAIAPSLLVPHVIKTTVERAGATLPRETPGIDVNGCQWLDPTYVIYTFKEECVWPWKGFPDAERRKEQRRALFKSYRLLKATKDSRQRNETHNFILATPTRGIEPLSLGFHGSGSNFTQTSQGHDHIKHEPDLRAIQSPTMTPSRLGFKPLMMKTTL